MSATRKVAALAAALLAGAGGLLAATSPASAASRDGVCDSGEFCLSYNSGFTGSISDFTGSIADYGASQPECYDFKSSGNGQGLCVKNNAASARNLTSATVRVYYNSNYGGSSQDVAPGATVDLNATLKNNNASHQFNPAAATGFLLPFPCAETWAASTRSTHSPALAVDFNHYPDDLGYKVYASAPGTVSTVADLGGTSYGKYIVISHAGGYKTYYAHLSSQLVSVGQTVGVKTLIGRVGSTGGSTGPHLHYEQRLNGTVVKAKFKDGNPTYYGTVDLQRKQSCP